MLFTPENPVNCPHHIYKAKGGEQPGNQTATYAFKKLKFMQCNSKCNANETQYNTAANMSQSAQNRKPRRFSNSLNPLSHILKSCLFPSNETGWNLNPIFLRYRLEMKRS